MTKREDQEDEHQIDTVPPPPGEEDAYSAETRIGKIPQDLLAAMKRAHASEAKTGRLPAADGAVPRPDGSVPRVVAPSALRTPPSEMVRLPPPPPLPLMATPAPAPVMERGMERGTPHPFPPAPEFSLESLAEDDDYVRAIMPPLQNGAAPLVPPAPPSVEVLQPPPSVPEHPAHPAPDALLGMEVEHRVPSPEVLRMVGEEGKVDEGRMSFAPFIAQESRRLNILLAAAIGVFVILMIVVLIASE